MDSLANRLRAARDAAGLTLQQIADACGGKSPQAVARWENGKATPNPSDLYTFATLTGVNLRWLITGQGARNVHGGIDPRARYELRGRIVPSVPWGAVTAFLNNNFAPNSEVRSGFPCGDKSFATFVEDNSNVPAVSVGALIIVDPDRKPKPGQLVMALIEGEALVRRYRPRDQHVELAPANADWPTVTVKEPLAKWLIGTVSEITLPVLD